MTATSALLLTSPLVGSYFNIVRVNCLAGCDVDVLGD
jgi:hypothetical protein